MISSVLFFSAKREVPKLIYFIFIAVIIFVAGFRDMIGGYDVYIYGQVFELGKDFILSYTSFEKGFSFYYILLSFVSSKREFMFFTTALFMLSFHYSIIKKYSPLFFISSFIFFCKFYLLSFVYLRQGLAMGLVWLSIPFIINKNYIKFLILVFVAFTFHRSAILFLPLIFLSSFRINHWQLFFTTVFLLIITVSPLGEIILNFLLGSLGDRRLLTYTSKYSSINLFYLVEIVILIYLALKFQRRFYQENLTLFFNGLILYILILIVSLTNGTFVRLSWIYFIFVVITLPYIYVFIKTDKIKKVFKILVFVFYTLVFFRLLLVFDGGDFLPYKSIFQNFDRNGMWEWMEYR